MTVDVEPKLVLGLSSGNELIVNRVMLFPETDIQQIFLLRTKAQEELGGFSTGLGFWGSPGWVIGGAAVLGFAESLVSNSKMKKGFNILKEAAVKLEQLKTKGVFFNVSAIEGIDRACPGDWRASQVSQFEIDLKPMGFMQKGEIIRRYNISRNQISDGTATVTGTVGFVHNDDDFVRFEVQGEQVAVRWTCIERYRLARNAPP